jgi:hypothetical protein
MRKQGLKSKESRFEIVDPPLRIKHKPEIKGGGKAITNWIATVVIQSGFCSLDAKFEADLNINPISTNLKAELDAKNFPLTAHATVTEVRTGKWAITDGNVIYTVYNEVERLTVY